MELKQKRACIVYAISALFAALIYSYKDAKWVNEKYAMFFKRGDTSSLVYIILMVSISAVLMPANTNALNALPKEMYPHGTAVSNMLQPIGGALGIAVFVSIMNGGQTAALEGIKNPTTEDVNQAMTIGLHQSYWFAIVLLALVVIVGFTVTRANYSKTLESKSEQ